MGTLLTPRLAAMGMVYWLALLLVSLWTAPVSGQSALTDRVSRMEERQTDARVTLSQLAERQSAMEDNISGLRMTLASGQAELARKLDWLIFGVISTVGGMAFGLLSVLWGLREQWARGRAE